MTTLTRGTLIALLLAFAGRADKPADDARAAYEAGSTEYDLGHYRVALSEFEKAFKLRHVPALLFNIAQCHRLLGELREAATVYRSFISRDPANPRVEQARVLLEQVDAALSKQAEAQAAKPTEVQGQEPANLAQPPASTQRTPAPQAATPQPPASPPPAPVAVVPQQPAPPPAAPEEPTVALAQRPARAIVPGNPAAPSRAIAAQGTAPAPAAAHRTRIWTWVALGGAAAAGGAGAVLAEKSASTKSSLADAVHSGAEVQSLQADQVSDAHRANALFIAGGALAAIAAAFFVLEF